MMAPEKGPNRLNMKFSESGRKVVIHLVRSLPPKISKDKKTITINLPPPQILVTTLDESKMKVYDSNSGVYGLWNEGIDANTELQILTQAKTSLHDDACREGILQKASDNARTQFTAFLTSLGFTTVTINISKGTC